MGTPLGILFAALNLGCAGAIDLFIIAFAFCKGFSWFFISAVLHVSNVSAFSIPQRWRASAPARCRSLVKKETEKRGLLGDNTARRGPVCSNFVRWIVSVELSGDISGSALNFLRGSGDVSCGVDAWFSLSGVSGHVHVSVVVHSV